MTAVWPFAMHPTLCIKKNVKQNLLKTMMVKKWKCFSVHMSAILKLFRINNRCGGGEHKNEKQD